MRAQSANSSAFCFCASMEWVMSVARKLFKLGCQPAACDKNGFGTLEKHLEIRALQESEVPGPNSSQQILPIQQLQQRRQALGLQLLNHVLRDFLASAPSRPATSYPVLAETRWDEAGPE